MKKRMLIFVLLLCLLFCGCKSSTDGSGAGSLGTANPNTNLTVSGGTAAMPGFDAQNKYACSATSVGFQAFSRYYWGKDQMGYLHFYDTENRTSHYMWRKQDSADATDYDIFNLPDPAKLISYDGKFWWVEQAQEGGDYYLYYSENPIIGSKTPVKRIDYEDVILTFPPQEYAIHRGNLYILCKSQVKDGGQTKERITVLASPLNASEEFTVLFRQIVSPLSTCSLRFVGTKVYYSVCTCPNPGELYSLSINTYDVATGANETVYSESRISEHLDTPWITETGEIYLGGYDYSNYRACLWKLERGKRLEVTCWEGAQYDVPYVFDGIAVCFSITNGTYGCDIRDFSGNVLYREDLVFPYGIDNVPGDPNQYLISPLGGDTTALALNLIQGKQEYTVLLDLTGTKTPTVLWHADPTSLPEEMEPMNNEEVSS